MTHLYIEIFPFSEPAYTCTQEPVLEYSGILRTSMLVSYIDKVGISRCFFFFFELVYHHGLFILMYEDTEASFVVSNCLCGA